MLILQGNRQSDRGRFRTLTLLEKILGKKRLKACIDRRDLVRLDDGRHYISKWDEWQEGDLTVGERMNRVRKRRSIETKDLDERERNNAVTDTVTKLSPGRFTGRNSPSEALTLTLDVSPRVQLPSSSSVEEKPETAARRDDAVEAARAELIRALETARSKPNLAGLTDQEILDRPEYHAPSGPVRLATCQHAGLLLATAGKLQAARKRKAAKDSTDWVAAEAAESREVEAWLRDNWPADADPQTEADLRGLIAAVKPPLGISDAVEAELFRRHPKADADWAARLERVRAGTEPATQAPPPDPGPAEKSPPAISITHAPTSCGLCGGGLRSKGSLHVCADAFGAGCTWMVRTSQPNPAEQSA